MYLKQKIAVIHFVQDQGLSRHSYQLLQRSGLSPRIDYLQDHGFGRLHPILTFVSHHFHYRLVRGFLLSQIVSIDTYGLKL
jgi:hypothetical protein